MLKKVLSILFLVCSFFSLSISAQEVTYSLVSSNSHELILRVDYPDWSSKEVNVNGTIMSALQMNNAYPIEIEGYPQLLKAAKSIIIPENSHPVAEVIESDFYFENEFELIPSKGKIFRNVDPQTLPFTFGRSYQENQFLNDNLVELSSPYQLRDYHGVAVRTYPFAYNPVQKILKVYTYQIIKVSFSTNNNIPAPRKLTNDYDKVYENHFINYERSRYSSISEMGEILIISPENYISSLEPFVNWKIKSGYPTTVVSTATAGNSSTSIKNYISDFYESHNLAFVIIVGDNSQFPSFTFEGETCDNFYTEVAGSDQVPDIILGKISAENITHVTTQIQKFIQYEENPPVSTHFPVFLGIASSEGPGDNNEYDFQHIRNIDNNLSSFTYTSGFELFEGNQGGLDASGNPTASMVSQAVNSGVGIINYCGHGSSNQFVTTGFSVSHVNNLTNYNKLPLIFAVACVNGDYVGQTCFAEAWLRATNNNQLTGAAGTLMSTMNQPWNSPMCAQDEINRVLTGVNSSHVKRTFGGLAYDGILKMLDVYNDVLTYRTWVIFGDPSLNVRTAIPDSLEVSYISPAVIGVNEVSFSCPVEGAKIVLSHNNEIISQGIVSGGVAILTLPNQDFYDTLEVIGTAFNYIPFKGELPFTLYDGPYVVYSNHSIVDQEGNNNGNADYGELVNLTVCLRNVGQQNAGSTIVKLRSSDPFITIIDSVYTISSIASLDEFCQENAFSFSISNSTPFQHDALFTIVIESNGNIINRTVIQHICAPNLLIDNFSFDDSENTNTVNGRPDFGETGTIDFTLKNSGDASSIIGISMLESLDGKIIVHRTLNNVMSIASNGNRISQFRVSVDPSVTEPTTAHLRIKYRAGNYSVTQEFYLPIGILVEDWETGDFSAFEWNNASNRPWIITTNNPYEGTYAAQSAQISNNETSNLSISVQLTAPDSISFYYFVSCEEGNGQMYDRLEFYIDNSRKAFWDGEVDWMRASFPVSTGNHTFSWKYVKDVSVAGGSDLARIDFIKLPSSSPNNVAIAENINANVFIDLYPNPTTQNVTVRFPSTFSLKNNCAMQLYNSVGQLITTIFAHQSSTIIPMENLAAGIYYIKILSESEVIQTHKVIKQ